ncbi:DNA cytosine methyltransferase [Kitasatospora aureofaciens]|uniref:DNA cytosine methyltransferase n=1 Tax=Kitasatospora aureofaciens TaxID=1894 RepID=UPI00099848E9|nr:DNA cytosine methyltransferase [Kitasatospora aureofaciens]
MKPSAIDLFAGAGGATRGLRDAGFDVLGAVEFDASAARTYRLNHPQTHLREVDIRTVSATEFRRSLGLEPRELDLLKTCPPCQGFSTLASGKGLMDEDRNDLVFHTVRFVRAFMPRAVLLENVPGLARDSRLGSIRDSLSRLGYASEIYKFEASRFGVPQRRKRLIMIALRGRRSVLPEDIASIVPDHISTTPARAAFRKVANSKRLDDPLRKHRNNSAKVGARIAAIPVGGDRFDLPEEHQLDCHKKITRRSATASYGRIKLAEPAPTMTTRCTTPACGSFVHPTENRGISLREAAAIQTFPTNYDFVGDYGSIERQIGNAVPVRMARTLGIAIQRLIEDEA